jgi:pentatricopeptide repeat protein
MRELLPRCCVKLHTVQELSKAKSLWFDCLLAIRQQHVQTVCLNLHVAATISPMSEFAYILTTLVAGGCIGMKHADEQNATAEHSSFQMVQDEGCQSNVVTYNALIDVYGKMGCWQEAVQVPDDMTEKVMSLHIHVCLQFCWVNMTELECNIA